MKEALTDIKRRLSDLRQDRTRFLTPALVADLYAEFGEVVKGKTAAELEAAHPLLHDVILLFSLAFITVGYTNYLASTYAITVTMNRILGYLSEDPALTPKELGLLFSALSIVIRIATTEPEESSNPDDSELVDVPEVDLVIRSVLSQTQELYEAAEEQLSELREDEWPLYIQSVRLRRDILSTVTAQEFVKGRMPSLQEKYMKIKSLVEHTDADNHSEPLLKQIENCHKFYEWFSEGVNLQEFESEPQLLDTFKQLQELMSTLEVFVMTRRWTLRGTDLYQHIKQLKQLTPFLAEQVKRESPAKRIWFLCVYMTRRSWTLVFRLLSNLEPVAESLASIYNQVTTMKRCLNEVQLAGGINNLRELYPYQMKLASLDDLRTDGKFMVDGEVPPGQGILNGMLAECYDLMYELKVELEEKVDQGEIEDDDSVLNDEEDENDDNDSSSECEDGPSQSKPMPVLSNDDETPAETPAETPDITPTQSRSSDAQSSSHVEVQ